MKKKFNVLFLFSMLMLPFAFTACSSDDDKDDSEQITLQQTEVSLLHGKSTEVFVDTGNGEYSVTSSNNKVATASVSGNIVTITATSTEDKANAVIVVTDKKYKRATIDVKVFKVFPAELTTDKTSVSLIVVQGSEVVRVLTGNGDYKVVIADPLVAKATIDGNEITITGKRSGTTTAIIEDSEGFKSKPIEVKIEGSPFAMKLGTDYFCYANFTEIAAVDKSLTQSKQVTFEMTCNMSGYRGLQTFMGLEGRLIMRGKNDSHMSTHPIEIAGLGDKIMLVTTSSFNLNEWMNIALVVDCDQVATKDKYKLYINGVQDDLIINREDETHKIVDLASSGDGNRFEIGRAFGQDFRAMQGTVSEARVWTVARTQQQIKDNMCMFTENDPAGLFARWDFSAGVETGYIQDVSGFKYESNLTIAAIKGDYSQVLAPPSVFVEKGCPK